MQQMITFVLTGVAFPPRWRWQDVRRSPLVVSFALLMALGITAAAAATIGAAGIPFERFPAALGLAGGDSDVVARDRLILLSIRLPRIVLAGMVGAMLAAAGTVMQGLFRNPLAEPGLVGVSAG